MHLSGISTYTKNLTDKLEGTNIKLADTRKTTPGLRIFEKYAFKCGGGLNHRMGLYDAAMIKLLLTFLFKLLIDKSLNS